MYFQLLLQVYSTSVLGPEMCTAIDVAVAKGGTEAVVESFYSVMKTQQTGFHMLNDTLTDRTIIDWCYPLPLRCPATISSVAKLYASGNDRLGLGPHRKPHHSDVRGRGIYSDTSKVVQRLKCDKVDLEILLDKDDLTISVPQYEIISFSQKFLLL